MLARTNAGRAEDVKLCCWAVLRTGEGDVLDAVEGENPFVPRRFPAREGVPLPIESASPLPSESSEEKEVASHVVNTLQADLRGAVIASACPWEAMARDMKMGRMWTAGPLGTCRTFHRSTIACAVGVILLASVH